MRKAHIAIGALAVAPVAVAALLLLLDPDPFDPSAAALISVGLMIAAVTSLSGLLLARAPWGRWGLFAVVVMAMSVSAIVGGPGSLVVLALGALALVGLLGPWLQLWVRHQTLTEAPGPVPIALTSLAAIAPLYVGLSASAGASWHHWLLALTASGSSIAYGRGNRLGIWGLRIAVPLMTAWAAFETEPVGAIALILGGIAVTVLAWIPAARRTTTIVTPPLPAPVKRKEPGNARK